MSPVKSKLEIALEKCTCDIHERLALAHVTVVDNFGGIIGDRGLESRHCCVLDQDVIYLSYGAPYYKPSHGVTQDVGKFPVVIVFKPEINDFIDCYYPFDTGALFHGMFGEDFKEKFCDLSEYCVKKNPQEIVSAFYGSNERYLKGDILSECVCDDDFIHFLHSFLMRDFTDNSVDQRHRTIECVVKGDGFLKKKIDFYNSILWLAYPNSLTDAMKEDLNMLWRYAKDRFDFFPYSDDAVEDPSQLVLHCNKIFREQFSYLFKSPGDRV